MFFRVKKLFTKNFLVKRLKLKKISKKKFKNNFYMTLKFNLEFLILKLTCL